MNDNIFNRTGALGNKTGSALFRVPGFICGTLLALASLADKTAGANPLVWNGTSAAFTWDIGTSTNWLNGSASASYMDGVDVIFNDAAADFSPILNTTVQPASVTFDATNFYALGGSGKISGISGLIKDGDGTLVISNANTFAGAVFINDGILQLAHASALGTTNQVYVTNGATLDLNNFVATTNTLSISGSGYNGLGALTDSSASTSVNQLLTRLVLTGDATIGVNGRWDAEVGGIAATITGNNYNLTKIGPGAITFYGDLAGVGNVDVAAGIFVMQTAASLDDPAKTLTVEPGAELRLYGESGMLNNSTLALTNGAFVTAGSTTNNYLGPISLVGTNFLIPYAGVIHFWNAITGSGGLSMTSMVNPASPLDVQAVVNPNYPVYLEGTNTYSGPTIINNSGKMIIGAGSGIDSSSSIQLADKGLLDVSAVPAGLNRTNTQSLLVSGNATIAGNISTQPGSVIDIGRGFPGSLTAGQLSLAGTTNYMVLGSDPTDLSGFTSSIIIDNGSFSVSGTNTFILSPVGFLNTNTPYVLAGFSGAFNGSITNIRIISANQFYTFSVIDPTTTGSYFEVQATGTPSLFSWQGTAGQNPALWDQQSPDWLNISTGQTGQSFANGYPVVFDDTAESFNLTINQTIQPLNTVFSNSVDSYVFSGSGTLIAPVLDSEGSGNITFALSNAPVVSSIINNSGTFIFAQTTTNITTLSAALTDNGSGSGSIVQAGSNILQLTANNINYSGKIAVTNGILRFSSLSALGQPGVPLQVAGTGSLDLNNISPGIKTISIEGNGFNGLGALYDSSTDTGVHQILANLNFTGDASIGGNGRWDAELNGIAATINGNGHNLNKNGTGEITLYSDLAGVGNVDVNAGLLILQNAASLDGASKSLTVHSNAEVRLYAQTISTANYSTLNLNNGAIVTSGGSANIYNGPIVLNGIPFIVPYGAPLHFKNTVSGSGTLNVVIMQHSVAAYEGILGPNANDPLYLDAANTYTGPTILDNNAVVILGTASSLGASPLIQIGSSSKLDISALSAYTFTNGQVVTGAGTIVGGTTVFAAGSTLAPGIGSSYSLTNNGNLILQSGSTNVVLVNKTTSLTNSAVVGLSSVAINGTLVISNRASALASGDMIRVFSATNYSGLFNAIIPPTPGNGLTWDTNNLAVNGILRVAGSGIINPDPTNILITLTGNQITLQWPQDHIGWQLQMQTNAPGMGLSTNWINIPGSAVTNRVVLPIYTNVGSAFYRTTYNP